MTFIHRLRRLRWKRIMLWSLGVVVALAGGLFVIGCCILSAPKYEGPITDHWDGETFHNATREERGFDALLKWMTNRDIGPWRDWVSAEPGPPPPTRVGNGELRVTFVNHATMLVQMDSVNLLFDPVWSERVGPFNMVGPVRHRPPGLRFEDLPPIDAVLVSHNHYDHMDVPTIRALRKDHTPPIYVGLGNTAFLEGEKIGGGVDLDWWQSRELRPGITITCVPARHFSGRGTCDRDGTLWAGFVITGPSGAVYFAGDTGWGDHFAEIGRRLGPIRLAMIPIGAYRPRWFMAPIHVDPQDAVRAHKAMNASTSVAIHFGTFLQADDGDIEPVEELEKTLAAESPRPRFLVLKEGEGYTIPPDDRN